METFSVLSTGTKFQSKKHGAAMQRFRPVSDGHERFDVPRLDGTLPGDGALPVPCSTLDLFRDNRHWCGPQDSEEVLHHNRGDSSTAVAHTPLRSMSDKRRRNICKKNELEVSGIDVPQPIEHFSDLAIPCLVQGRDVLACAPTGSGKTLAFLVPMFARLREPDPEVGVRALIVTPTMELAEQIEREVFLLMKGQRWKLVRHGQSTRNKDIFVTTPGRVAVMLEKKLVSLDMVQYLVFDEGDRLWDSTTDNLQVVDVVLTACTLKEKVVALFTATLSAKIESIARSVMSPDVVRIIVAGRTMANRNVKQELVFCGNELGKIVAMRNLVREGVTPPVLVFVQSIERTKELYEEIHCQGLHIAVMNSKMTHEEREATMIRFRLGKIWVLVTTELLSRGIDFKNVGTVINFDIPVTVESYIHRIGRCGRAGKTGRAITFFTEEDRERVAPIARIMKESGNAVEDWMLDIRLDRQTRRRLQCSTPQRMIVSTRKRMHVANQRMNRQLRRLEREGVQREDGGSSEEDAALAA